MQLGVDVGGTFTDAALIRDGRLVTAKAPSTPADPSLAVLDAVGAVLGQVGADAGEVERLVHGMTVGTNALLEGKTARTALLATEGFTDLEQLGRQARAELYRLCAGHPPPLVPAQRRVPVPERCDPDGVVRALDEPLLSERLEALEDEVDAVAVCLLWGFRHPEHERRAGELAAERSPGIHVSTSHETAAVFREYERLATTVVDAALSPLLRAYLERLQSRAREAGLRAWEVMLSSGGVVDAATAARHGSWTVLSGPAGGAAGAAALAERAGSPDAICLDMGGTSCDVSVALTGEVAVTGTREVAGRALALPMVDVHTVGAGGGSVAWRDAGGALRVGPRSAGADPGPACYGRGGTEPTVTDANLLLGYLDADSPLAGGVRLDAAAAERAVGELGDALGLSLGETAAGIVRVAGAEMAAAARVVTVERGIDPRDLALLAFGGAGPLHAIAIAEELGVERVIVPRASGVLSALGLVVSERRRDLVESVLLRGAELTRDRIATAVAQLVARGRDELSDAGAEASARYDLRYAGQAFELTIAGELEPDPARLRADFEHAHEQRYGYSEPDDELELVSVSVRVALPGSPLPGPEPATFSASGPPPGRRTASFEGKRVEATLHRAPDAGETTARRIEGPAVCELGEATLVVPPGWAGAPDADGTIVLERHE